MFLEISSKHCFIRLILSHFTVFNFTISSLTTSSYYFAGRLTWLFSFLSIDSYFGVCNIAAQKCRRVFGPWLNVPHTVQICASTCRSFLVQFVWSVSHSCQLCVPAMALWTNLGLLGVGMRDCDGLSDCHPILVFFRLVAHWDKKHRERWHQIGYGAGAGEKREPKRRNQKNNH